MRRPRSPRCPVGISDRAPRDSAFRIPQPIVAKDSRPGTHRADRYHPCRGNAAVPRTFGLRGCGCAAPSRCEHRNLPFVFCLVIAQFTLFRFTPDRHKPKATKKEGEASRTYRDIRKASLGSRDSARIRELCAPGSRPLDIPDRRPCSACSRRASRGPA